MELILYKFIGNDKKIDKPEPGENAITLQGHLRESCDIKNPIITVSYNAEILKCNYAKITAFDKTRYYFVKKTINGKTIELSLLQDVLKTYAEDIKKASAFAIRSSQGSYYIPDEMVKKETKTEWQFRKLGNGLNSGNSYILILGGS